MIFYFSENMCRIPVFVELRNKDIRTVSWCFYYKFRANAIYHKSTLRVNTCLKSTIKTFNRYYEACYIIIALPFQPYISLYATPVHLTFWGRGARWVPFYFIFNLFSFTKVDSSTVKTSRNLHEDCILMLKT